jgi:Protein of unknown function (DUF1638)
MAQGVMPKLELAPSETLSLEREGSQVLLIACGALAREIVDLVEANHWNGFDIQCLPAKWHNTPDLIVPGVRDKISKARGLYKKIYVLYGDCGTGGQLDTLLEAENIERIDGPHCYAFFSGNPAFATRAEQDMTAFFLTDYLARHFDKLIWEGLGLHKHPELLPDYFGNYTKIVYLAQTKENGLREKAEQAAKQLGLDFEYRFTGYGELSDELAKRAVV